MRGMHSIFFLWTFLHHVNSQWSIPFVWDVNVSNSLATLEVKSSSSGEVKSITVSLDLGSSGFAAGTESVHPGDTTVKPVLPLPQGPENAYKIVPNSILEMSYGSGNFSASMATTLLNVGGSYTNVTLGAMYLYYPPFPMGGPKNDVGILGLSWEAYLNPPPYCVNGSTPVSTDYGKNCDPEDDAIVNSPLLNQLNSTGLIERKTIEMLFFGSTQSMPMNRYGTLTYGKDQPTYNCSSIDLQKIYGQEYQGYYLIRVPSINVDNVKLPYSEADLEGNTNYSVGGVDEWIGGWIVDSGWNYDVLPTAVYDSLTSTIWSQYTGCDISEEQWNSLVSTGKTDDCTKVPDWCSPLEDVPCVVLSSTAWQCLPTITFVIGENNDSTWDYRPEDYLYPLYAVSANENCYQLGLLGLDSGGIIGNLHMSGHQVFLDQDQKMAFITPLNSSKSSNSCNSCNSTSDDALNWDIIIGGLCSIFVFFVLMVISTNYRHGNYTVSKV